MEPALNFEHFEKKNEPHSSSISGVIDSQRRVYLNAIKDLVSENSLAVNVLITFKKKFFYGYCFSEKKTFKGEHGNESG